MAEQEYSVGNTTGEFEAAVLATMLEEEMSEQIRQIMDLMEESEQEVLIVRYGLNDGIVRTLDEVGRHFNMTREQVRQIEKKAVRKISLQNRPKRTYTMEPPK